VGIYLPPHFEQTDPAAVRDLIGAFPLATLVTTAEEGVVANHIPFQLADEAPPVLRGHVARNNEVWHATDEAREVLAIFQAPDAYITPTWYETKRTTHEVVPTWDYAVVHVFGRIRFVDDPKWLRGVLGRLTRQQEARRAEPWRLGLAPAEYLERQLGNIVGVEIAVTRTIAKWKMSQNRSAADREGVIAGLETEPGDGAAWVAAAVRAANA
jgi:transcriptional regulator